MSVSMSFDMSDWREYMRHSERSPRQIAFPYKYCYIFYVYTSMICDKECEW